MLACTYARDIGNPVGKLQTVRIRVDQGSICKLIRRDIYGRGVDVVGNARDRRGRFSNGDNDALDAQSAALHLFKGVVDTRQASISHLNVGDFQSLCVQEFLKPLHQSLAHGG